MSPQPSPHLMLCSVCGETCALLDVVDFNKSCAEPNGTFLDLSGVPIYYALCPRCGFCFAPEMATWTMEELKQKIYNDGYPIVDPEYLEIRPRKNAHDLISLFGNWAQGKRHLDYGGGHGLLAQLLSEAHWHSSSYDPFHDDTILLEQLGRFEIITALEVFEHVPNAQQLMAELCSLRTRDGMVLFSTLLSDGHIQPRQRLTWWYAAPRNGHISLYSSKSLAILAKAHGLLFTSFSPFNHAFFTQDSPWHNAFTRPRFPSV